MTRSDESLNAFEAEERLWHEYLEAYRHPPRDFAGGFRPLGGFIADFTVVWHEQRMHMFHIDRRLGETECAWPGHEIFIGHASTGDLVSWEVHDPVLLIRPGTWEGCHVGAPYIQPHDGRYVMAYQGINEAGSQNLGLAFSDDLFEWKRSPHNPISPLAQAEWAFWRSDGTASCRDAHLNFVDDRFWLNFTACTREGGTCIAMASSSDLVTWNDHGPIIDGGSDRNADDESAPFHHVHHIESSALIPHEGHWLLFGIDRDGIHYWESPTMDRFDYAQGKPLWKDVGPGEVAWRDGSRWLMCACHYEDGYGVPGSVLRFGEIDWSDAEPEVRMITGESRIADWVRRIKT